MKKARRSAQIKVAASRTGRLFAGCNIAFLAACAPAIANGPSSAWSSGHVPANHQINNQANAVLVNALTQPVVPHAAATPAATLPIATQTTFSSHQHLHQAHNYSWQQNVSQAVVIPTAVGPGVQLDLTSGSASIVLPAGIINHDSSVTISMGGAESTFHTGDKVTAGELVAIYQSQGVGGQKIVLDSEGRAQGGSFSLNSMLSANRPVQISGVVVPQNVTAFDYVSGRSNVSMGGDLVNYGSIVDVTRGHASASISALNIVNESSGSISTVGRGTHSGVVDLVLDAAKDFTNLGTISSSGSLSIFAGGTLSNGPAAGTAAGVLRPTISAVGDVNLQAPQINNTGLISSSGGNVNLGAAPGFDLNVNNNLGTISALTGAINVRDSAYAGVSNSTVVGGDLLSKDLNLHAGGGTLNVDVNQLTGHLESDGLAVHVLADTDVLHIGSQCLTGDPTYYNKGDIVLDGSITATEAISIIASGNITASPGNLTKIQAQDGLGQGYNITIIAGAPSPVSSVGGDSTTGVNTPGTKAAGTVTFNQPTKLSDIGAGGYVDLTGASGGFQIDSSSTLAKANGGNIFIGAFGNDPANGGATGSGKVILPNSTVLNASAGAGGTGGDVGIFAGNRTTGITAINIGSVVGANNVAVQVAQPEPVGSTNWSFSTTGAGPKVQGSFNLGAGVGNVKLNGAVTAAGSVFFIGGSTNSGIDIEGAITSNGAVTLASGGTVNVGKSLSAPAGIAIIATGDVTTGGSPGNTWQTASASGNSGNVLVLAGETYSFNGATVFATGHSATGGSANLNTTLDSISTVAGTADANGGNIRIAAATGSTAFSGGIYISTTNLSSGGNGKGTNGDITLYADSVSSSPQITIDAVGNTVSTAGGGAGTGTIDLGARKYNAADVITPGNQIRVDVATGLQGGSLVKLQTVAGNVISPFNVVGNGGDVRIVTGGPLSVSTNFSGTINELYLEGFSVSTPLVNAGVAKNFTALSPSGDITVGNSISASSNISLLAQGLTSNINIGNVNLQAGTGGILMLAGSSIRTTAAGGTIVTSATSNAGAISMVAGVNFGFNFSPRTVALFNATAGGGNIDFATNPLNALSAESLSGAGGAINLVAFKGSTGTSGVLLPSALTVRADSFSKIGGSLVVVADAGIGTASQLLNADTTGSGGNSTITLSAATPNLAGVSIDTSTAAVNGTFFGGTLANASVFTGKLSASDNVSVYGGADISLTDNVKAPRIVVVSTGGDISIGGSLQADQIAPPSGGIVISAAGSISSTGGNLIAANASNFGVNSGSITMISGADVTVDQINNLLTLNGSSGLIGNMNISANVFSTTNVFNGNGGDITLVAFNTVADPANSGQINFGASKFIETSGVAKTGNVQIIAGTTNATNAIVLGSGLDLSAGPVLSGDVLIASSTPITGRTISTQTVDFGTISGTFAGGALAGGTTGANLGIINQNGGRLEIHQGSAFDIVSNILSGTASNLLVETGGGANITVSSAMNPTSAALISGGDIILNGSTIFTPDGLFMSAAGNITDTAGTSISTTRTGNSGPISMFAGASTTVSITATGDKITVDGPSGLGGSIDLSIVGSLNTFSKTTGNGGDITLAAFADSGGGRGQVLINTGITVRTNGSGGSSNGSFVAVAGGNGPVIQIGNVDTTNVGSNVGKATITLQTAAPAIPANGAPTFDQTGNPTNKVSVVNLDPPTNFKSDIYSGNLTTTGGDIQVLSSRNVRLGNLDSSAPAGAGFAAGNITVTSYNGFELFVGATPADGKSNYIGTVTAKSTDTANGDVSISHFDQSLNVGGITLMGSNPIQNSGNVGVGSLTLIAGQGSADIIDLGANTNLNYNASSVVGTKGNAGSVTIQGGDITWMGKGTTPLKISANASADGDAGTIDVQTSSSTALNLDKGGLNLSATGAAGHTDAGTVIVQTTGNITFDPAVKAIDLTPASGGKGGNITLKAGYFDDVKQNSTASLLVTGSINADGNGGGAGGTITLAATGPTLFNVGQLTGSTNGVQGAISVLGGTTGLPQNGSISIENGGAITTTTAFTDVDEFSLHATGPGSITLGGAVGTPGLGGGATDDVFILADMGSIIQSNKAFVVGGINVILATGPGAGFNIGTSKAAFVVNAVNLTVNAGDTVNISAVGTAPQLSGANGSGIGSFTLVTTLPGGITSNKGAPLFSINAKTNLTLTAPVIDLQGDVLAGGTALITATTGNATGSGDLSAKSVKVTAAKGLVDMGSIGLSKTLTPDDVTITSLSGITTDSVRAINAITLKTTSTKVGGITAHGSVQATGATGVVSVTAGIGDVTIQGDVSGGKSVSIAATKGGQGTTVDIVSVGTLSTGSVTISSIDRLIVGSISAVDSIVVKTTDSKLGFININGDVKATNPTASKGVVSITSANDVELDQSKVVQATKSITITSGKSHVLVGNVGKSTDTVTITAAKYINVGAVNAINTATIRTTTTSGDITFAGDVVASSATKGVVAITALGFTGIDATGFDVSAGKSATLTAGNGSIKLGTAGMVSPASALTLTASGPITVTGDVKAVNSITAKTTTKSTTAGAGEINFAGDVFTTSTTAGVVSLTSSGTGAAITLASAKSIQATKSATLTASKGDVSTGQIGSKTASPMASGTIAITAFKSITTNGDLVASKSVTLKTTSKNAGEGNIIVHGNILAFSKTGTVALTSSSTTKGGGIMIDTAKDVSACTSVTLSATAADITTGSIGGSTTAKAVMTALNSITNNAAITVQASDTETVTGVGGILTAKADISALPPLSPFTSGTITLTASQGAIDTTSADLTGGKSVTLTALKGTGTIDIGTVGKTVGKPAGTLVAKALHEFKNIGVINTAGPIAITTSASTLAADGVDIAGDMNTAAGGITVTSGGTFLKVESGVDITATGTAKVKAPIVLLDTNKTGSLISFLNGSTVTTKGLGGDKITVAVGTVPTKGTNLTNPPGIVIHHVTTGDAFFGPAGGVDNTSTGDIFLQGADVIFNSPLANAIKLTGAIFTADPPVGTAAPSAAHLINTSAGVLTNPIALPSLATGLSQQDSLTPGVSSPARANQINFADVASVASQRLFNGAAAFNAYNTYGAGGKFNWISATEVDGGEIPVSLLTDGDLTLSGADVAQMHHMTEEKTQHRSSHLKRGSVLSIAKTDRKITTAFGEVSIAANSMVLVMALEHGMAVYNFDDTHPNAVTVKAGGKTLTIHPGTSALIARNYVNSFDQVNPAQLVFYRRLTEDALDGNLKAFRSEFAVHSAMRAIKPLRDLVTAKDKETHRVANHFLKTTAILLQVQGGGESFRQIMKPRMTASAAIPAYTH